MSQPPGDDRGRAPRPVAPGADPSTDGRGLPYESLYRASSGEQRPSGVRQYEPSLRPPEGADGFGWLFRDERPAPEAPTAPPATTAPGSTTVVRSVEPIPTPVQEGPRPRRRRLVALLIVLLVVAIGAGVGTYLVRTHVTAAARLTVSTPLIPSAHRLQTV